MVYKMYEYLLNLTNDTKLISLGNEFFLKTEVRTFKNANEPVKYFIFTISEELELFLDITLTFNFKLDETEFHIKPNEVLLFSSVFLVYKQNIVPHTMTHLFLPSYQPELKSIVSELLSSFHSLKENDKCNMSSIEFREDITQKLEGLHSIPSNQMKDVWERFNFLSEKGVLPPITN